MKRHALLSVLALSVATLACSVPAYGTSYYGYTEWGGTWHDANKDWAGDTNLCWAAAASNILDWSRWGTSTYSNHDLIFENFENHWTDLGSLPGYGWDWWLNGTAPPASPGWSQVDGGGNHWPEYDFLDYFHEYWGAGTMPYVDSYLHAGYGVTLAIYRPEQGHALTAWGYEYDPSDSRYYTGVWVTDSDDDQTDLDYYSLRRGGDRWFLNGYGGEDDWHIGGVQALGRIPEPGTLLLFGSAVAGLAAFRFRRKKRV